MSVTSPYSFFFIEEENRTVANPIWPDSLSKVIEKEADQQFYREKLSGNLVFIGKDYEYIMSKDFDAEIQVFIYKDSAETPYFRGKFYRTDCKINAQDERVEVSLTTIDSYEKIISGLDKEFDLISLAPSMKEIGITKRPAMQIYVAGDSVITTYVGGIYFEQEAKPEVSDSVLKNEYCFGEAGTLSVITFWNAKGEESGLNGIYQNIAGVEKKGFSIKDTYIRVGITYYHATTISRLSDGIDLWQKTETTDSLQPPYDGEYTPISDSVNYPVNVATLDLTVYQRYLTDSETWGTDSGGQPINTYPIPDDDITDNSSNYRRVIGVQSGDLQYIYPGNGFSDEPTEWGMFQPGIYYDKPKRSSSFPDAVRLIPVGKSQWGATSIWWLPSMFESTSGAKGSVVYKLKHAYSLSSCISVLLEQLGSDVTFDESAEYSEFFYDDSGIIPYVGQRFRPFITPSSNILAGDYDQPAQKATITLGSIFSMLKNCFQCFWFIEDNKLRIEHIFWFKRGGNYLGEILPTIDLTNTISLRSGKSWSFGQNSYEFMKNELPEWYQFSWANDVSKPFQGFPIKVISNYVQLGNIETISVDKFVSDVDLMLLNPSAFSKDTFTLLLPERIDGSLILPIWSKTMPDYYVYSLQNGYASFLNLQKLYTYDIPGSKLEINGQTEIFQSSLQLKRSRKQTIKYPLQEEQVSPVTLIKTDLGTGSAAKIEINLSSQIAKIYLELPSY